MAHMTCLDCKVLPPESIVLCPLHAAAEGLLSALYTALPFVEDAEDDPAFDKGIVTRHVRAIRKVIRRAEGAA